MKVDLFDTRKKSFIINMNNNLLVNDFSLIISNNL